MSCLVSRNLKRLMRVEDLSQSSGKGASLYGDKSTGWADIFLLNLYLFLLLCISFLYQNSSGLWSQWPGSSLNLWLLNQPGGQPRLRPPSTCMWMWKTVWPASSPLLKTSRYCSMPSSLEILSATLSILPITWSSSLDTSAGPLKCFLGMTRKWTGAWGAMSRKAKISSSS